MRLISSEPAKINAAGKFTQESVIEYTEDITEIVPAEPHPDGYPVSGYSRKYKGKRTMRARVRVVIDLRDIAVCMGKQASQNKTGYSQRGSVKVVRVKTEEVARAEVKPFDQIGGTS